MQEKPGVSMNEPVSYSENGQRIWSRLAQIRDLESLHQKEAKALCEEQLRNPPVSTKPSGEPKEEDYETYEEFWDAYCIWRCMNGFF